MIEQTYYIDRWNEENEWFSQPITVSFQTESDRTDFNRNLLRTSKHEIWVTPLPDKEV
jgi:hypothetical protein